MPCSFDLPYPGQRRAPSPAAFPSDRDYPLHTARDRCLWHAGGTAGENDDGSNVAATAASSTGG
jgi:hypothetical protein